MHDKTAPYPGMPELLAKLKKNGVKMAVFSNKADEFARAVVARYFDSSLFEIVRGALPDVPTKPAPQGTCALMQKLGVTAESGEVLYVGDSNVDVATAHNAGLPCCGVLWGFRTQEELQQAGAEYLAATMQDLEKVILRADITYEDGTTVTKYAKIKSSSAYSVGYLIFYEIQPV